MTVRHGRAHGPAQFISTLSQGVFDHAGITGAEVVLLGLLSCLAFAPQGDRH